MAGQTNGSLRQCMCLKRVSACSSRHSRVPPNFSSSRTRISQGDAPNTGRHGQYCNQVVAGVGTSCNTGRYWGYMGIPVSYQTSRGRLGRTLRISMDIPDIPYVLNKLPHHMNMQFPQSCPYLFGICLALSGQWLWGSCW